MTTLASDAFTRTASSTWGTATTGQTWALAGGGTSSWSVNGSQGLIAIPFGSTRTAFLDTVTGLNVEFAADFSLDKIPVGANAIINFIARRLDGTNDYQARVTVTASTGAVTLRLQRANLGFVSSALSWGTLVAGTTYRMRVQTLGNSPTTVNAKMWDLSGGEPSSWDVTGTDSTANLQISTGYSGVWFAPSSGGSNGPITLTVDNVAVTDGAATYPVTGTVAATSAVAAAVTELSAVTGTAAGTTAVTGAVSSLLTVAGSTAATTAASGTATARYPVSGSTAATSAGSGAVTALRPVSGQASAVSGASGAVTLVPGAGFAVAGAVAAVSTIAGSATLRASVTGQTQATTTTVGAVRLLATINGTVIAATTLSGTVNARQPIAGTITATTTVTGTVVLAGSLRDITLTATPLTQRWTTDALEDRWATIEIQARYTVTPLPPRFTSTPLPNRFTTTPED